jgi:serine phosphatase RsbU (regulator of sigma subunit)/sugar lactone lactonase YvrE
MDDVEKKELPMKEEISIEGTLLMLDNSTPHVAVPVQAIRDGEVIATTLSDESGKYQFISLRPGRYQVRCQVLGGYVYYRGTDYVSRFTFHDSQGLELINGEETGEILQIGHNKTLNNIDFRFAPFKKGAWRSYSTLDGLGYNAVNDICCTPDGVMWFATGSGGVSRYDGKEFVNLTTEDGLVHNVVEVIYRDPDGVMWFGAMGGLSRYDGEELVNFTAEDGLPRSDRVTAIHRDPDGVMWLGTEDGISRYDGQGFVNFTTEDGLAHNWVNAIHRDPDGVMWFGTHGGVSRYDGEQFTNFTTKDGLTNNWVNVIHRDPDGVMWFGTGSLTSYERGGISRYDGEGFVNFTTRDGLADNHVWCVHRDPDGVMWFGTWGGGVSRYDGRGIGNSHHFVNFTTDDGLAKNFVTAIHRDPDGMMWFGTDGGGVSCCDGTAWTSLDTRDGLAGNSVFSICQDPEGFLWFGTEGGITRYRRSTTPPKVHIVSVTTDQTYRLRTQDSRRKTEESSVPAFTIGTRVTIEYNSIDLKTLPEKRQYRCRIREIDSDWRKPTKATSYDFIFDEPGEYTLEVQAIDRDLNYSEPASVELKVVPDPRNHQIAQLRGELAERERAELDRVHQELEDARQIQQSLLPEEPPEVKGFEIADTSLPAREVSGDFYNYLPLGDGVGIVLADVTGKSVKAAMVAALADGMLSEETKRGRELWNSPSMILRELNIGLQPRLIRGMFTAMSLGIICAQERKLLFSNAGMPYPIVKHGKEVWELEVHGMPLGLVDRAEYHELSFDLEARDFVVLYSDGVIEAENEAGEMYQTERLLELIQQADPDLSAQEVVDLIVKDITAFVGDEVASDDITIVVVRRKE